MDRKIEKIKFGMLLFGIEILTTWNKERTKENKREKNYKEGTYNDPYPMNFSFLLFR